MKSTGLECKWDKKEDQVTLGSIQVHKDIFKMLMDEKKGIVPLVTKLTPPYIRKVLTKLNRIVKEDRKVQLERAKRDLMNSMCPGMGSFIPKVDLDEMIQCGGEMDGEYSTDAEDSDEWEQFRRENLRKCLEHCLDKVQPMAQISEDLVMKHKDLLSNSDVKRFTLTDILPSECPPHIEKLVYFVQRLIMGLKISLEIGVITKASERDLERREYKLRTERERHKANMSRLERLDGHVAEKDKQISTLREEVKKTRKQISELGNECQNRRATEARLTQITEEAEKEITFLKKQNVEQVADMNAFLALEQELKEQKGATKKKKQKIKKLNKKLDDLQAYHKNKVGSLKEIRKSLEQTIQDMKNESTQRVHEIVHLEDELRKAAIQEHCDGISDRVHVLKEQIRKGQDQLEQSDRRYLESKRELEVVSKDNAGLLYRLDSVETDLQHSRSENVLLQKKIESSQKRLRAIGQRLRREANDILDNGVHVS